MTYLHDVHSSTPTRFWVNNPTRDDSLKALDAGAVGVTTNPAFGAKLLQSEPEHIHSIITSVIASEPDNSAAAERVYHLISQALMEQWMPVFEESGGTRGFVTIQEDPRREEDPEYIMDASLRASQLSPNYMAKVPVTVAGLVVIRKLVEHNIAICATEIFSIAQYRALLQVYSEASQESGHSPFLYATHITGILDEYFKTIVKNEKCDVNTDLLAKAGTIVGMRESQLHSESDVAHRVIGGGARGLEHFTNYVGRDIDITMNWSTAEQLNSTYRSATDTSYEAPSESEVAHLAENLPNFARALEDDGLASQEFADFGPVMLFRTQFLNGYCRLVDAIADARR